MGMGQVSPRQGNETPGAHTCAKGTNNMMRQDRFTEQAQEVLQASQEMVRQHRHAQWDVEHVFLALLSHKDGLARQIRAAPVGEVRAFGDRLQARQLNNLRALQGGKSARDVRSVARRPAGRPSPSLRTGDTSARSSRHRTASRSRAPACAPRRQRPPRCGPVAPGTTAACDSGRGAEASSYPHARSRPTEASGRASYTLHHSDALHVRKSLAGISCITYDQGH